MSRVSTQERSLHERDEDKRLVLSIMALHNLQPVYPQANPIQQDASGQHGEERKTYAEERGVAGHGWQQRPGGRHADEVALTVASLALGDRGGGGIGIVEGGVYLVAGLRK